MLATITAALAMLYAATTAQAEGVIRRIHEATISLVTLDRQMVGRLTSTVVPDFMYLEYRSLYLELRPSCAAWRSRGTRDPTEAAVAGRPPYHSARRDASPHHAAVTSAAAPVAAPPQARASVVEGFTAADRKMLEQIYRASVYGETPTYAQRAGDVRRRQIAYGVTLYKPSSRYVKGVSSYVAARQAVRQFEDAEGAYSSDEIASLAKAIRREYQKPGNCLRT